MSKPSIYLTTPKPLRFFSSLGTPYPTNPPQTMPNAKRPRGNYQDEAEPQPKRHQDLMDSVKCTICHDPVENPLQICQTPHIACACCVASDHAINMQRSGTNIFECPDCEEKTDVHELLQRQDAAKLLYQLQGPLVPGDFACPHQTCTVVLTAGLDLAKHITLCHEAEADCSHCKLRLPVHAMHQHARDDCRRFLCGAVQCDATFTGIELLEHQKIHVQINSMLHHVNVEFNRIRELRRQHLLTAWTPETMSVLDQFLEALGAVGQVCTR